MDSYAFASVNSPQWERLEELSAASKLTGEEADEFVRLYQATAGNLATVRSQAPEPGVILRLSAILAKARSRLTMARSASVSDVADFFAYRLPLAFYRIRWWILAVGIGFIAVFLAALLHYVLNPSDIYILGSEQTLENYANEAFEAYYREYSNSDFAVLVWTNNAWIAFQCVAGGITGFFPLWVLWQNAVSIGQSAAVMNHADALDIFFQLITPHGLLEITAIIVAGAAGLRIFWAAVRPGNLPRIQAIGQEGRQTMLVAVGLVIVLFISGLVEGFVTPSYMHWGIKIMIGALVWLAFLAWMLILGRRASKRIDDADEGYRSGWTIAYQS